MLRYREPAVLAVAALLASCGEGHPTPQPSGALPNGNRLSTLRPGPPSLLFPTANRLPETDIVIAEGQRLFQHFDCSGCHAAGGGAIGPALTDDEWIYGSTADNIFWTIVEGRPQGMPAFGGRIAEENVWKIVAYVRSLAKLTAKSAEHPPVESHGEVSTKAE